MDIMMMNIVQKDVWWQSVPVCPDGSQLSATVIIFSSTDHNSSTLYFL